MAFRYDRLKSLRKEKGYKQVTLAKALHIGRSTLAMWETGRTEPTNDMLPRLASLLGCSVGYLLGTEDEVNATKAIDALRAEFQAHEEMKLERLLDLGQQLTAPSRSQEWRLLSGGLAELEQRNHAAFQAIANYLTAMYPDIFKEGKDEDDPEL